MNFQEFAMRSPRACNAAKPRVGRRSPQRMDEGGHG